MGWFKALPRWGRRLIYIGSLATAITAIGTAWPYVEGIGRAVYTVFVAGKTASEAKATSAEALEVAAYTDQRLSRVARKSAERDSTLLARQKQIIGMLTRLDSTVEIEKLFLIQVETKVKTHHP